MSIWQTVTWNVARTGGFTAYLLLTLAVAVGLALGILALYLGIAVGINTWLRPLIGYAWWRRLHVLTLGVYGPVTVHGIATGSDTQTWWGLVIYGGSIALIGGLLCWRLLVPVNDRGRAHPILASMVGLAVVAGFIFAVAGPLQPGWNAVANGAFSGNSLSQSVVPSPSQQVPPTSQGGNTSNPFAVPFTASFHGTLAQSGPDTSGAVTLHVNATLSDGAQGVLTIILQGSQESFGGQGSGLSITSTQVKLGQDAARPLYQGYLTDLRSNEIRWRMSALLSNVGAGTNKVQAQIEIQVDSSGQVTGVIQGAPVQGSPSSPNSPSTPTTQQV